MLNYEKFLEKLSNRNTKLDWRNLESLLEEHVPYVLEDIKSGKSIEDISKVYKGIPFGSVPDLYIEDPKKHKRESYKEFILEKLSNRNTELDINNLESSLIYYPIYFPYI
jgi:hypothetical protein